MARYLIKRLLQAVPIMLLVSMIVFFLMGVMGNPVRLMLPEDADPQDIAALTRELGLDKPIPVRYAKFMGNLAHGDFGRSTRYNAPALPLVLERLPLTLKLSALSVVVAICMAVPLGVLAAVRRNSWIDLLASAVAVLGAAMPSFWQGLMLMLLVAVTWRLVPASGVGTWKHLVLPVLTLGTGLAAILTRLVRSGLLEVLGQDYTRTARSKGLSEWLVIFKHALRNALIPIITVMGLQIAGLIEGSFITETIFALPGMGRLTVQALAQLDFAIVQTAVLISAFVVITVNLAVDVIYTIVDPRIRYQ
jgi:peptide/nickel transport system permease protein